MKAPDTINGRTPEEIKLGLECCLVCRDYRDCLICPYGTPRKRGVLPCECEVKQDILALINQLLEDKKQLERERDALEALEKQPKWISVKERLPEKAGGILICAFEHVMSVIHTGNGVIITADLDTWNIRDKYITHWMPFPQPPKEET